MKVRTQGRPDDQEEVDMSDATIAGEFDLDPVAVGTEMPLSEAELLGPVTRDEAPTDPDPVDSRFPGAKRVAVTLMALGTDVAAPVVALLAPHEVEAVILEMKDLEATPVDQVRDLLRTLLEEVMASEFMVSGSFDRARDLLRQSHGADADAILERIMATTVEAPFQFLRARRPDQITSILTDEDPQIIAMILSFLPINLSSRVIEGFERDVQAAIAAKYASLQPASPQVVSRVEATMRERIGAEGPLESTATRGGIQQLAQMLNSVSRDTERSVLSQLEAQDPVLASDVRDLMFVFEDLVHLDDRSLQAVLRDSGTPTIGMALRDPNLQRELRDKILRNISQRAQEDIEEMTQAGDPVRRADVEAAQQEIVRSARRLENEGKIIVARGDSDVIV